MKILNKRPYPKHSLTALLTIAIALSLVSVFLIGLCAEADNPKNAYIHVVVTVPSTGAKWHLGNINKSYDSGATATVNANNQTHYTINFIPIDGYITPDNTELTVTVGATVEVTNVQYVLEADTSDVVIDDLSSWPLYPQRSVAYNVWEPYSFTSIGRDVIAWVVFNSDEANPTFWISDLNILAKTGDTVYSNLEPICDNSEQSWWYVADNSMVEYPGSLDGIDEDLRESAVVKAYDQTWMEYESQDYPNQDFVTSWFSYDEWRDFLQGNAGFTLEDSGHAPPLPMWEEDNWLTFYVDEESVPVDWIGRIFVYFPTNQGILNAFEVFESVEAPSTERIWSVSPLPAFKQAVYHQVRKENDGLYSRIPVLDGPVTVHDVQNSSSDWKRILVGTTGIGTRQTNKIGVNWLIEDAPVPSGAPSITDEGRLWGVYALDITDPDVPVSLWSATNIFCSRQESASINRVDVENAPGGDISGSDYQDIKFMVSKPLIGFTQNESGERTWHLILVTIDKSNQYLWLDVNPVTGEVFYRGHFLDGETVETVPSEDTYQYNFEDWYPSRILAAYPQSGGLPVLSDVYVYLSNGSFFKWDLNDGDEGPSKLFDVFTNTSHQYPAPPITDFDIAYIDGDVYLAATAPLNYPGIGQPHDTYGLLIVNISRIESEGITDLNTQGAQGQGGDTKIRLMEDGVAMVQLQTGTGNGPNAYDFDSLAASPLFVNYVLYQALYSSNGGLSRLYTLDMGYISGLGGSSGNAFLPDDAFIDDTEHQFAAMTIDSEGNLIILDPEGNTVLMVPNVLNYSSTGTGTGTGSGEEMRTIYWKRR